MTTAMRALDRAEIAAAITDWGVAQSETMWREKRGSLSSELFDIRGRTWVGFECYYAAAPEILRKLGERLSPEEIGARMRRPGSRPYYLQLFILMSNYLCAREQRVLADGVPPEAGDERAEEDLWTLVEFFVRCAGAYRSDGGTVPSLPELDQRILSEEWIGRCEELLEPPERLADAQRATAALSLYNFLLHGEQRDGNFDHGPYRLADGTDLLLRELNDLDNDFLPWADRERRLPCSNVCIAYALRDVEARFSIFGGCLTDPVDFGSRVERLAVFTVQDGVARPLGLEELDQLAARAAELQGALYQRIVEWPSIERTRYGLWLYANHLVPFLRLAGAEDLVEELVERFEPVGKAAAEQFAAAAELPEIFHNHTRLGQGSMFSPLAGAERKDEAANGP